MESEIKQIVPAAAGWRVAFANLGYDGGLEGAPLEELVTVLPIAAFGMVTFGSEDDSYQLIAFIAEDWPATLTTYYEDRRYHGCGDHLGYAGPGELIDKDYRELAIDLIGRYRKAREEQGHGA